MAGGCEAIVPSEVTRDALSKRIRSEEWDFESTVPNRFTHRLHHYPAALYPDLVSKAIREYGPEETGLIFDPFCGSGTTLVEAIAAGHRSIGTDINPLALLISQVKTTPINPGAQQFLPQLDANVIQNRRAKPLAAMHRKRLSTWFKPKQIQAIQKIRAWIALQHEDFNGPLHLALSNILRPASFQRNREFKLYRIPKESRKEHTFDVIQEFVKEVTGTMALLDSFSKEFDHPQRVPKVIKHDALDAYDAIIPPETVDLVLTSPPYGDSETTVAYAQFSWLSNMILGLDDRPPGQLDRELLGGRRERVVEFGCESIDRAIENISLTNPERAAEVRAFFLDYAQSIHNAARTVRPGGKAVYVVGNRRVAGEQLQMDAFTAHVFEECGFNHKTTILRAIQSKRMPYEVSPSNQKGSSVGTMVHEYIVVCERPHAV